MLGLSAHTDAKLTMDSIAKPALTFPSTVDGAKAVRPITPEYLFTQAVIKGRAFLEDSVPDIPLPGAGRHPLGYRAQ